MTMEEIRDLLLKWLEEHRAICPEDPLRCHEPVNALAFLAHSVGMHSSKLHTFQRDLLIYEENCVNCPHVKRG